MPAEGFPSGFTQTDAIKTPLPQPVNSAELSLVNESLAWNAGTQVIRDPLGQPVDSTLKYGNFYAPPAYPQFVTGDAINLSGLFKWRKDAINPTMDATTGPGYIPGKCGFSAVPDYAEVFVPYQPGTTYVSTGTGCGSVYTTQGSLCASVGPKTTTL